MADFTGKIKTREWEEKEGEERKTTEIIAQRVHLGPNPKRDSDGAGNRGGHSAGRSDRPEPANDEIGDDDIPF